MKCLAYAVGAWLALGPALFGQAETDAVARVVTGGTGKTTVWTLIQAGGWAMIPMGVLSVVTVMLVIAYSVTMRRGAVLSSHYMNTADVLLKKGDYLGLLAISNRHGEAIARVVRRTLDFATRHPGSSVETLREIAETEASTRAASLQHRVVYLADVAVISPMVGLFGTVLGIIKSFGAMASQAQQAPRAILLAAGVSEALVATAAGLVLGIVAMAFYALFRGRAQRLINDLDVATAHVLGMIALRHGAAQAALAAEPGAAAAVEADPGRGRVPDGRY